MVPAGATTDGGNKSLRKSDIVRLRRGFDRSLEAIATRRAGLPLKESALFEILGCERGDVDIVLTLREVYVVYVAGARRIAKVGSAPFPYVSARFELV
jgi:hypothetical protein